MFLRKNISVPVPDLRESAFGGLLIKNAEPDLGRKKPKILQLSMFKVKMTVSLPLFIIIKAPITRQVFEVLW